MTATLYHGDCLQVLKGIADNSVDSAVMDPPAGISFMGLEFDHDKGGRDKWIAWLSSIMKECLRVLKPGGHALVWALPRTSHWTGMALETAGFEVRDCISYLYDTNNDVSRFVDSLSPEQRGLLEIILSHGDDNFNTFAHIFGSGFPKSHDISKAIDQMMGAERDMKWQKYTPNTMAGAYDQRPWLDEARKNGGRMVPTNNPATPQAVQWQGWGTALKPAYETWWLVRKPIAEDTVAANVLAWGTGGINIDGTRVEMDLAQEDDKRAHGVNNAKQIEGSNNFMGRFNGNFLQLMYKKQGRFPANLAHDGSAAVLAEFPQSDSGKPTGYNFDKSNASGVCNFGGIGAYKSGVHFGDKGSAARFFYCAKAAPSEREVGLAEFDERDGNKWNSGGIGERRRQEGIGLRRNHHPTVKPVSLMRFFCKLITPTGGTVLDPFMGSGTTGVGAQLEGFNFIGIEQELDYFKIAQSRIAHFANEGEVVANTPAPMPAKPKVQQTLF